MSRKPLPSNPRASTIRLARIQRSTLKLWPSQNAARSLLSETFTPLAIRPMHDSASSATQGHTSALTNTIPSTQSRILPDPALFIPLHPYNILRTTPTRQAAICPPTPLHLASHTSGDLRSASRHSGRAIKPHERSDHHSPRQRTLSRAAYGFDAFLPPRLASTTVPPSHCPLEDTRSTDPVQSEYTKNKVAFGPSDRHTGHP